MKIPKKLIKRKKILWLPFVYRYVYICLFSTKFHNKLRVDLAEIFWKIGLGPTWQW